MSRVYIEMDTLHPVQDEDCGIYVPPTGSCDDCTIFEERLTDVENELPNKQDILTAGTNITIVDNVISATGSSITVDSALSPTSTNPVQNRVIDSALNAKQDVITSAAVTIAVGDWAGQTAVKTVSGVTASNRVLVTYAPSSKDDYLAADIYASAQGANSLTFKCTTTPSASVTANVMIID